MEQTRWQYCNQIPTTEPVRLVQIGAVPALITDGLLDFSIPGGAQNLQAKGGFVREEANGDYVWWANLTNETGYVGVAKNSAGKFVQIQKDNQFYQLHPLSGRYNALVMVSPSTSTEEMCPHSPPLPEDITLDPSSCNLMSDCKGVVSVLVLVTPEAVDALGFTDLTWESILYLPLGLHSTNFALQNSGVYGKTFRFIIEEYDFDFTEDPLIQNDLAQLRDDQDAQARRAANKADLMVLLTDERYTNALGGWYETFSGPWWFGIVNIEHMAGVRNVFAHELGHALSLNHNRVSNGGDVPYDGTDVCAFGWRFLDMGSVEWRTIMATIPNADVQQGESQILNYSNPEVSFNGEPTGTIHNANAFKISQKMCVVDDNFTDEELEVAIDGPDFICEEVATYTADIVNEPPAGQPGSPPFTYYWAMDDDGFFSDQNGNNDPVTYLGNTPSIQFFSPDLPTFWLFLRVFGSNGVSASSVMKVETCASPTPGRVGGQRKKPAQLSAAHSFRLSPNPTQDYVRLQFDSPISGLSEYTVSNSMGQIMASGSLHGESESVFDIDLTGNALPPGPYYFALRNRDFFGVQTLFVNR